MPIPEQYDYHRYLAAKKSVDDRALNRQVWDHLAAGVAHTTVDRPLRILEVGAGIGTMVERVLDWGLLQNAEYLALDVDGDKLQEARIRLAAWAQENGYGVSEADAGELRIEASDKRVKIRFLDADATKLDVGLATQPVDLLIAHAFLDLLDVPAVLPGLLAILRPGGLFYFSINYDGEMYFAPRVDAGLDEEIIRLYHKTMDQRVVAGQPSGDSHTGRHLFQHLVDAGAQVLAAGGSDWVVSPTDGGYAADEAYFLHFILHTMEQALKDHPALNTEQFNKWLAARHSQVERGELFYFAHQLDYFGRMGTTES